MASAASRRRCSASACAGGRSRSMSMPWSARKASSSVEARSTSGIRAERYAAGPGSWELCADAASGSNAAAAQSWRRKRDIRRSISRLRAGQVKPRNAMRGGAVRLGSTIGSMRVAVMLKPLKDQVIVMTGASRGSGWSPPGAPRQRARACCWSRAARTRWARRCGRSTMGRRRTMPWPMSRTRRRSTPPRARRWSGSGESTAGSTMPASSSMPSWSTRPRTSIGGCSTSITGASSMAAWRRSGI